METSKLNLILETLKDLPYQVIWKFESDSVLNVPHNVKLLTWAPQQDILSELFKMDVKFLINTVNYYRTS